MTCLHVCVLRDSVLLISDLQSGFLFNKMQFTEHHSTVLIKNPEQIQNTTLKKFKKEIVSIR